MRLCSYILFGVLRGNKPIKLEKMHYKTHALASKLKDSSIYDYNPQWLQNNTNIELPKTSEKRTKTIESKKKTKLGFDNF